MERRDFIKNAGIIGASASIGIVGSMYAKYGFDDIPQGGRSVNRTTGVTRLPLPTTCMLCPARCGVIGFLEDSIPVKLEGNPRDINSRGKICSVGVAGIQMINNPDRLLSPMKRVGTRGDGKWQKISWDEAISQIASKINSLRKSKESEKFVFLNNIDSVKKLTQTFLKAIGNPVVVQNEDLYRSDEKGLLRTACGVDELLPDLSKTKYVLNFGTNIYEHYDYFVPAVARLADGLASGMKLVTFDPRITNTSGKSSEWFTLNPGSDMFVALAMANVILKRGHHDADFIKRWVDISVTDLVHLTERFTPEIAEAASGIKESHIRRIAIEFASSKPSIALFTDNFSGGENTLSTSFAVFLLNLITGSIDSPGGMCIPRKFSEIETDNSSMNQEMPQTLFKKINDGKIKVEILFNSQCNPVFTYQNTEFIESTLKNEKLIPFHVVYDNYLTETAKYADIILPAATYLESWGINSPPSLELVPQVVIQQPLLNPRGESKQLHKVFIEIAQKAGEDFMKAFQVDKLESFVRTNAEQVEGLAKQEGGFENLKETGVWNDNNPQAYRIYEKKGFPTSNKKVNISSFIKSIPRNLDNINNQNNAIKGNEFELVLCSSAVHINDNTPEMMWLSEIEHENFVWINRISAANIGLKNGDEVKLITMKNSIFGEVRLSNGIHPKVIAMNRNLGHWMTGKISRNENIESHDSNTNNIWWTESGRQPHAVRLIDSSTKIAGEWNSDKCNIVRIEKL